MKILSFIFTFLIIVSCNSTNYEIIEEPVEPSDNQPRYETMASQENSNSESENITLQHELSDEVYEIQLGAFGDKTNADNFYERSRQILGSVNYRESDNITRITYGNFHTTDEANRNLERIRSKGFKDAFIRRLSR
ncbi:MAG: SPOR domain-containing protein [Ignavibacteria bacterium]|nr:SPOR domain-containing protein [Ignavibacteria bacterium]